VSFNQILLCGFIQYQYLFLLLFYGTLQLGLFLFLLLNINVVIIFFSGALEGVLDVLDLLWHKEDFGFSLSNFHSVYRVLFVQLDESLFQLNNFFVYNLNLLLNVFLRFIVSLLWLAFAFRFFEFFIFFIHYFLGFNLVVLLELRRLLSLCGHVARVADACGAVSGLELNLQLLNLSPQICNDVFICWNMLIDHLLVWLNFHLYVFSSVRVL